MSTKNQNVVSSVYARAASGKDYDLQGLLQELREAGVGRDLMTRASQELIGLRSSPSSERATKLSQAMIGSAGIRDDLDEQAALLGWPKAADGRIARAYRDVVDGYEVDPDDLASLSPKAREQFATHAAEIKRAASLTESRDGTVIDKTRAERLALVRANELVGATGAVNEPRPEPVTTDPRELAAMIHRGRGGE